MFSDNVGILYIYICYYSLSVFLSAWNIIILMDVFCSYCTSCFLKGNLSFKCFISAIGNYTRSKIRLHLCCIGKFQNKNVDIKLQLFVLCRPQYAEICIQNGRRTKTFCMYNRLSIKFHVHLKTNLKYIMLMVSTPCDLIEIRCVMFVYVFLRSTNILQHPVSGQVRGLTINQ